MKCRCTDQLQSNISQFQLSISQSIGSARQNNHANANSSSSASPLNNMPRVSTQRTLNVSTV